MARHFQEKQKKKSHNDSLIFFCASPLEFLNIVLRFGFCFCSAAAICASEMSVCESELSPALLCAIKNKIAH